MADNTNDGTANVVQNNNPQNNNLRITEVITPGLSKHVQFTQKVDDVDTALKNRRAAQKSIKLKWAAIVKWLNANDITPPSRRPQPDRIVDLTSQVEVFMPLNPRLEDKEKVKLANTIGYELRQTLNNRKYTTIIETQFPGFTTWAKELEDLDKLSNESREVDETETKIAKAALQVLIDECLDAIEAYDETIEDVSNVKEYIDIVKDVATIAAIADGVPQADK